mmetsp:Transcript_1360/g.2988  ORF Transcript_1360/g.2988 Transcript_1360/m.2988 type:complete len:516 (+) Transcript_1360:7448-8995(+)
MVITVPTNDDLPGARIINMGEGNAILAPDGMADNDLVDVVELVPVLLLLFGHVAVQRLELGSTGYSHVEGLGRQKLGQGEEMLMIRVQQVRRYEGRSEAVQARHDRGGEAPGPVRRAVRVSSSRHLETRNVPLAPISLLNHTILVGILILVIGILEIVVVHRLAQRLVLIEPAGHEFFNIVQRVGVVVFAVPKLHSNWLGRLHVQDVICIVQNRLLVIERRKPHPLEVTTISLLAPHHNPSAAPLRQVHRLNYLRNLIDKADGTGDVVQDGDGPHGLPWHGHVLQKFEHGVGHVFESSQIYPFIRVVTFAGHVTVVRKDLPDVLGGEQLLVSEGRARRVERGEAAAVRVTAGLELRPAPRLLREGQWSRGRALRVGGLRERRRGRHARGRHTGRRCHSRWRNHTRWGHTKRGQPRWGHPWRSHSGGCHSRRSHAGGCHAGGYHTGGRGHPGRNHTRGRSHPRRRQHARRQCHPRWRLCRRCHSRRRCHPWRRWRTFSLIGGRWRHSRTTNNFSGS